MTSRTGSESNSLPSQLGVFLFFPHAAPSLFGFGPVAFAFDPAHARGSRWPSLVTVLWWRKRAADQVSQALARILAVLSLRPESTRFDDQDALVCNSIAGERAEPIPDIVCQGT